MTEPPFPRKHAILSASSSAMWIACPPSARLNEAEREETSEYAAEGTLGHDLTELHLSFMLEWIDTTEWDARRAALQANTLYSEDLALAVNVCVRKGMELIHAARDAHPDALVLLERKLDYSRWVPEGFGTGDLVIVTPEYIHTVDWKFGRGEWVDAVDNSQLRLYAAGALDMFGAIYGSTEVRSTVVQPRVGNIDTETISAGDLLAWMEAVVRPAAELAWAGQGEFKPGHKQCRWCKVRGKCRARAELNLAMADEEFRMPHLMSDDELATLYPKLDEIILWAQDVQKHADRRVLAGANLPGLKAVEGRSSRAITDVSAAYAKLIAAGLHAKDILRPMADDPPLITLTDLEKLVGREPLAAILGDLIAKPPGKTIVVPSDDKRIAVDMTRASAEDDFNDAPA